MMLKQRKKTMLALIVIAIAFLAIVSSNFIVSFIGDVSQISGLKLNDTSKDKTSINVIGEMRKTHTDGDFEVTEFTPTGLAMADGKELYCVNHGTQFYRGETLRIEDAKYYGDLEGGIKLWPTTHAYCRFADDTNVLEAKITYPLLECIGRHYNLLDRSGEYHPDLAYILTYPSMGEWDELKQNAVWATEFARARGNDSPISSEGIALYEEALKFERFAERTATVQGSTQDMPSIDAQDRTNTDMIKIMPNYNDKTYIVGPFSIDYINGIYENIAFGGISDMYMIGYNEKEEQIKERIEIKSYIVNNQEYQLQYFDPNQEEYVDRKEQVYPKGQSAGEYEFYLKIENPNAEVKEIETMVSGVKLHIDFKYLGVTKAYICEMDAHKYQVQGKDKHEMHCHGHSYGYCSGCCYNCTWSTWLNEIDIQDHINVLDAERKLFEASLEVPNNGDEIIDLLMELGGHVWEDALTSKENIADGYSNTAGESGERADRPLKNVKVTLYECEKGAKIGDGEIAKLPIPKDVSAQELMHYVNPTLTDENGDYLFKNLDPLKKYYVSFEYNGQIYLPTEYLNTPNGKYRSVQDMVNAGLYNTDIWEINSKGTETEEDREDYNKQFEEIGSYPENYRTSNSLGVIGRYNATFTQKQLMGYTLDERGYYNQTETQLIDGFLFDRDGNETDEFQEGEISIKIRKYIEANQEFPDEDAMLEIYSSIARNDIEMWRKLQFIEDCKIESYTQPQGGNLDLYPVYDAFVFRSKQTKEETIGVNNSQTEKITIADTTYEPIYPGQYYVNQGLWPRQLNDLSLRKDVYRAATKINGKTEVYQYNERTPDGEEPDDDHWQIHLRMQDYDNYYGGNYNRELYHSDYTYKGENGGNPLEVYVTYQITVRNVSQGILNEVTEVVDYYDQDFIYMPNLSWVMYRDNEEDRKQVSIPKKSYYNMIHNLDLNQIEYARPVDSSPDNGNQEIGDSIYGEATKQDLEREYNSVYVRGLQGKKLQTGENAYIYLTFKVKSDNNGPVILDDANSLKHNIAEINGYTNYYADGTELPNDVTIRGNNTPAGIIDRNSTPGNITLEDLQGNRYERNFENDTDRAKGLQLLIDPNATRKINGFVWEDERNKTVADAVIGDGARQDKEIGVQGVTVQLVEKLANGNEYVWESLNTVTGTDGRYELSGYIPGNYVVRFSYGNNNQTVLTTNNGGQNQISYNGQDFKSTIYQKELDGQELLELENGYYDIQKADEYTDRKINLSDAKDVWEIREKVNNYSSNNVTNHVAEVLASPYANPVDNTMIQELIANTSMTANTAIIVAEVEYNRTNTGLTEAIDGTYYNGNNQNGNYVFHNVDLGLTERPKAQMEINKKVANVKITLANGNIIFDATKGTDSLVWVPGKGYELKPNTLRNKKYEDYYKVDGKHRYSYREEIDKLISKLYPPKGSNGLIQAIMDEELMHGATIQITYNLNVKNVGETDYAGQDFYYKANGADSSNIVTTTAGSVVDYVANNLQYRAQDNIGYGWELANAQNLLANGLVSNKVAEGVKQFNTILTTNKIAQALKPGEDSAVAELCLTQTLTPGNPDDNKMYDNIAEIMQTSNTVGRRMAYSVVGNQDPTTAPTEVDTAKAEKVLVLPPFGTNYLYYGLAILVTITLVGGIVFIKKKMSF